MSTKKRKLAEPVEDEKSAMERDKQLLAVLSSKKEARPADLDTQEKIAKHFKVSAAWISILAHNKDGALDKLRQRVEGAETSSTSYFREIEVALNLWLNNMRRRNVPISYGLLREKAASISKELVESTKKCDLLDEETKAKYMEKYRKFQASHGFVCRFCHRFAIVRLSGNCKFHVFV